MCHEKGMRAALLVDRVFEREDGPREWWKQSSREKCEKAALKMLEAGMDEEPIEEIISDLFWAGAQEFGG